MGNISEQIMAAKYYKQHFATSQTTQLMAGSINEDDRTIMKLSVALYKKNHLKRVYHDLLKKMRVSLKRSIYFITCNGIYKGGNVLFSENVRSVLTTGKDNLNISSFQC